MALTTTTVFSPRSTAPLFRLLQTFLPLLVFSFGCLRPASAQTSNADQLKKLQDETAVLRAEIDKLKAEKDLIDARFPKGSTSALTGNLTNDSALEAISIGHWAAARASKGIAVKVASAKKTKIVVYSASQAQFLPQYYALTLHLDETIQQYKRLLEPQRKATGILLSVPPGLITAVGTNLATSFLDFLALFRTDTAITKVDFTVAEDAIVSEIAQQLRLQSNEIAVFYPSLMLPVRIPSAENSPTLARIQKIESLYAKALQKIDACDASKAECTDDEKKAADALRALSAQFDKLKAVLLTDDPVLKTKPIAAAVWIEALIESVSSDGAILYIKVQASGGSNRITRNLWTNFGAQILSHRGGAVITFILLSPDGSILKSGTSSCMTPYKKVGAHQEESFVCIPKVQ